MFVASLTTVHTVICSWHTHPVITENLSQYFMNFLNLDKMFLRCYNLMSLVMNNIKLSDFPYLNNLKGN